LTGWVRGRFAQKEAKHPNAFFACKIPRRPKSLAPIPCVNTGLGLSPLPYISAS